MNPILIIGVGGHSRSVISVILSEGIWKPVGIVDTETPRENEFIMGVPVSSSLDSLLNGHDLGVKHAVVAIGDNKERAVISKKLTDMGFYIPNIISPNSIVDPTSEFSSGAIVMPGAVICAMTKVGNGCIINTNAVLDHESSIADWVHLAPGAVVAGRSHIGKFVFLGANSTVIDKCRIVEGVIIGAGSTVISDICDKDKTYIGSPVRRLNKEDKK